MTMPETRTHVVPLTVMVVDDDWMNRELMETLLRRAGFQPVSVNSGEAAISKALQIQPSLILCDLRMAGISGYEVCRVLKSDPSTSHIPIIILSGYETEEEHRKALEAGAVDFIPKLHDPSNLIQRVRELAR